MRTESPERIFLRTTDFDEAVATMREAFGNVDLRRRDRGAADLSIHVVRTADLSTSRWTMANAGKGRRDEDETMSARYLTGVRLGGDLRMWSRWVEVDTDRPFFYPDPVNAQLDRPDIANLSIAKARVDERAHLFTGDDTFQVRFTGTAPIDRTMDGIWRDTMAFSARTMDALTDSPAASLARTGLVDMVASLMLRTFPNTTLDAADGHDMLGPRGAALRRAVHYIDDHLDVPVTVPDIADAARLSARGLYAAFRRELRTTPMDYLRHGRLTATRDDLRTADPGVTTVAQIALRWGFAHPGHFAERYRAAFGETPADTLHR